MLTSKFRGFRDAIPRVAFPVTPHSSGLYNVDAMGRPSPILSWNAWSLPECPQDEQQEFLSLLVSRSFNWCEVWAPNLFGDEFGAVSRNRMKDGAGNIAFLKRLDGADYTGAVTFGNIDTEAPDLSTPNPAYWLSQKNLVHMARQYGVGVMAFWSYVGFQGTSPAQGLMAIMVANGTTKCQAYGTYLATFFKDSDNLVKMLGGDWGTGDGTFSAPQLAVHDAYVTGLTSVNGQRSTLYSAEWKRNNAGLQGSIATDLYDSTINLIGVYVGENQVCNQSERALAHSPQEPAFILEYPFADHPSGTGGPPRRFAWWGCLGTINGYTHGDWNLYLFRTNPHWRTAAGNAHAGYCKILNELWLSLAWFTLRPDQSVITAGGGTADTSDEVRAVLSTDNRVVLLYRPPNHSGTTTIDRTKLSGAFDLWFVDPTTGARSSGGTGITNTGTQALTWPGTNAGGDTDWAALCVRAA